MKSEKNLLSCFRSFVLSSVEGKRMLQITAHDTEPPLVRLIGEAGFHDRGRVSRTFERMLDRGLFVIQADLGDLIYIDTSALSALIKCAKRAEEAGGWIEIVSMSEPVSRVLTLCGLAGLFKYGVLDPPMSRETWPGFIPTSFWHVCAFAVPATPEAAVMARCRVASVLESLALDPAEAQDILVAVGEALANAIRHGCACCADLRVSVKCIAAPSRLTIDISDPGPGFDPGTIEQHSPNALKEGGMGIYMMRELMDEVGFSFGDRTTVRLAKRMGSASIEARMDVCAALVGVRKI